MEFTTWLILWALVTSAAVGLAYWRMFVGLHDVAGMHIAERDTPEFYEKQRRVTEKTRWIDIIGISMTALSALGALGLLFLWAFESAGV